MDFNGLNLDYQDDLWLGMIPTQYGLVEVLFNGTADAPSESELAAFHRFRGDLDQNIARLRSQISFRWLYRPIRIAVNKELRVGVQFLNRFTGNQGQLILE